MVSFNTSPSDRHSVETARHASTLLWALAGVNGTGGSGRLSKQLCVVVDLFAELIVYADRGHQRRLWKAELACAEIAAMWPEIRARGAVR